MAYVCFLAVSHTQLLLTVAVIGWIFPYFHLLLSAFPDMRVTVISVIVFVPEFKKAEMMQDSTSFYPAWTAPIV